MSFRILMLAGTALAASAAPVLAQTSPTQTTTAPPSNQVRPAPTQTPVPGTNQPAKVEDVVVTGRTTDIRSSIDSVSYSLRDDLQAQSGTLADALRNVPSVDVDPQGNVSLRGDGNVTILVDGRPSAVFTGESRSQAIQSLPADQYARIEVMTNPSAAYSPEGGGGVINLITKPTTQRPSATTTGSIRANAGDHGRWNVGVNGTRAQGPLTISGDLSARHDFGVQETTRVRERLDPSTGAVIDTTLQNQDAEGEVDVKFARLSGEYKVDDHLQFTAEARGHLIENFGPGTQTFQTDSAAGVPLVRFSRNGSQGFEGGSWGVTGRMLRRFDEQGHEWSTEVRFDRGDNESHLASIYQYDLPARPDLYEDIGNVSATTSAGFTSAYIRPMPNDGKLRAGYEFQSNDSAFDLLVRRGPSYAALTTDPAATNSFQAVQSVHALYTTYERPFGDLSAQFGLRLEYADLDLDQVTTGIKASQDYFRAYPTLHVTYQIDDAQSVRGSYSRRIQRPVPFQLNPFVLYQDPYNRRSGNAALEPQETDSFEVMWQRRAGPSFYQATAYYRDTKKAFSDAIVDLGGGVFLTRPENLGARRDYGVELVANGALHPTLRYNASLNVFQQEIDAAGILGGEDRSGMVVTGRATLNWQPTSVDFLQISGFWQGEQLLAQGRRESGGLLNLGYRRKIDERWSLLATARDVFDNFSTVTVFETPNFRDRQEGRFGGRAWYLGLTYNFGGGQRRPQDPQFDFTPPPGG